MALFPLSPDMPTQSSWILTKNIETNAAAGGAHRGRKKVAVRLCQLACLCVMQQKCAHAHICSPWSDRDVDGDAGKGPKGGQVSKGRCKRMARPSRHGYR